MASGSTPDNPRERFFSIVVVPINKNGDGPCNLQEAVLIGYEVWDGYYNTMSYHEFLPDAIKACEQLNKQYYKEI